MRAFLLVLVVGCSSTPQPPPIARDDHFTIAEDAVDAITAQLVSANDDNVDNVRPGDAPLHGQLTSTSGLGYTPDPGYHGPDQFTYYAENYDGESSLATVTIDVTSDGIPFELSQQIDHTATYGLAIADIDGDGKLDLVTLDGNVRILVNASTPGTYAVNAIEFEGGHQPNAVATGDFDGDGRPDIAIASKIDGIAILRNLSTPGGAIAFDAPVYLPGIAQSVVATDLDGDGHPDLATIDPDHDVMNVYIDTSTPGTLAFGTRTSFATSPVPISVVAVDADGVGGMDLAVLSNYPSELSLFTNATSIGAVVPAFAARIDRATQQQPRSLFIADLDGDGRSEIGVTGAGLWLYKNQSPTASQPSFEAARVLALPRATTGAVLALDLDATPGFDLMLGSAGSPFTLLLNRSSIATGFAFDTATAAIGGTKHKPIDPGAGAGAMVRVELDGVAPDEIVLATGAGMYVLYGD